MSVVNIVVLVEESLIGFLLPLHLQNLLCCLSFELSLISLETALSGSLAVTLLSQAHLELEVHRCQPVHYAVLVVETGLGHVKSPLHRHGQRNSEAEHKAGEQHEEAHVVCVL